MADDGRIVGYALFGFIFGLVLFWRGFSQWRIKRLIEQTPTSKIRSIAMGLVEIFGKAESYRKDLFSAPFSGKKCVWYKYTIEEYRSSGKSGRWVKIKSDSTNSHFVLRDDTGAVLVDPHKATVEIPISLELKSGTGRDPPTQVRTFLESQNIKHEGFLGLNKNMRYREYIIEKGTPVYILGTAGDNPFVENATAQKNEEDIMIRLGRREKTFYISTKSEKELLQSFGWKVFGGLFGGSALTLVCLAIMFLYFGIL